MNITFIGIKLSVKKNRDKIYKPKQCTYTFLTMPSGTHCTKCHNRSIEGNGGFRQYTCVQRPIPACEMLHRKRLSQIPGLNVQAMHQCMGEYVLA